jgi:predicted porin
MDNLRIALIVATITALTALPITGQQPSMLVDARTDEGARSSPAAQAGTSVAVSSVVECASSGPEMKHCAADTSAGVIMLHPSGSVACLLGRNWGYDASSVWVTEGCSGTFATGSTTPASAPEVSNILPTAVTKSVTTGVNPEIASDNKYVGQFAPYGSLRTIIGASPSGAEVQDDASRIGINFSSLGKIKVFAQLEWGVNIVQSNVQFNAGATTEGGFGTLTSTTGPVLGPRLGLVGVDLGPWGKVSFGKQNSVYYDITSDTTDRFNVFGGQASATYVGGTDGGETGTGRADQVVQYRNTVFKILDIGMQGQFRGANVATSFDGFGFSVQARVLPGVTVGTAYNKTYFSNAFRDTVAGSSGGTHYWTIGAKGNWRIVDWGAVFATQQNGDLTYITGQLGPETFPVMFNANGVELYSRVHFGRFAVVAGLNDYAPQHLSPLLAPDFRTRYAILGAEWHFSPAGFAFFEARLGDSVNGNGQPIGNAAAIGFRYDYLWKTLHIAQ